MKNPIQLSEPIQLLVEGNDYRNFFEAFCKEVAIENVQIQNFGGIYDLTGYLKGFVNVPGFETVLSVGIVRDAENSELRAFRDVSRSLRRSGLNAPEEVGKRSSGSPAVTVLILPGRGTPGMLETLICKTIESTSEISCVDAYFECLKKIPSFTENKHDKARVHAWLASKPEPHVSVGVAAKKSYFDLNHSAMTDVRKFLSLL